MTTEKKRTLTVAASFAALLILNSAAPRAVGAGVGVILLEFAFYAAAVAGAVIVTVPMQMRRKSEGRTGSFPTLLCAAALGVLVVGQALSFVISGFPETNVPTSEFLVTAALGVLVKPAAEEYLFRIAYVDLLSYFPWFITVAVQAFLFAAWHPAYPIFALLAGAVLGLVSVKLKRERSKYRYISLVAVHAAFNLLLYAAEALF